MTGKHLVQELQQKRHMGEARMVGGEGERLERVLEAVELFLDSIGDSNKYIKRSLFILEILSQVGWMKYSEIKKAIKIREGQDISDSRLQDILNNLIKNKLIYKISGINRTSYYIISEKGLRIIQAMSIPLPPPIPPHVSYFPASDPFAARLSALIVDAKTMQRVLSLRGTKTKILESLGQYEKIMELMLNLTRGDRDDIDEAKSRLSRLSKEEKEKLAEEYKKFSKIIEKLAEFLNQAQTQAKSQFDHAAYSALRAIEKRKSDIGIDHVLIYVTPGDSDEVKIVLYKYSMLSVGALLLSTLGLELSKPFTFVLYVEGSVRAIGILNKMLEILNNQYNIIREWNLIAEELADGIDCCPDQAYEYIFKKEPILAKPFKPKTTLIILDDTLARQLKIIDLSKLNTLSGENTIILSKNNIKLTISKETTLIEIIESKEINISIEAEEFKQIPFNLILLPINRKIDEKDIYLKLDTNKINVISPPILVKRTYGEGYVETKMLLPEGCEAAKLYYDKSLFTDPQAVVRKIMELARKSKSRDGMMSLYNFIHELLYYNINDNNIFSCKVEDGVLLKGNNKIKINIYNSNNIWLKLYIINNVE